MPINEFEFVKNISENARKDNETFIKIYKAAIELLTSCGNGKIGNLQLTKSRVSADKTFYAEEVVDYYINTFRGSFGPILMDRGVERTGQGEYMEIAESNKPIHYVGLNSCIGATIPPISITVPRKIGVHLVIPFDDKRLQDIYTKRIEQLKKFCSSGKLVICGKTPADIETHLDYIKIIFPEDEQIKWLSDKIESRECRKETNSSGNITV